METATVLPQDTVAPPAPVNVQVTPSVTGWWVTWEPSNAPDLVEYHFTNTGSSFSHTELPGVTRTELVDTTAGGQQDPNWTGLVIYAIDDDGNVSPAVPVVRPVSKSLNGWPKIERTWWGSSTTGGAINMGPRDRIYSFGAYRYPDAPLEDVVTHRNYGTPPPTHTDPEEWYYGFPSEFVGASIQVHQADPLYPPPTECHYFKIYRSSPAEPVWTEVTTSWQRGIPSESCLIEIEDRFLEEPTYTYYVVSTGTEIGGSESLEDIADFTYMYDADQVMGQYAYGARLAVEPGGEVIAIDPNNPGWELGGSLAGDPIVVTWRRSLHPDVVGYRIWAYDGTRIDLNYNAWVHLGDVASTESTFLDYGAPCAWPVEYLTQSPSEWNEYTCTLQDIGGGCYGQGNPGALVRYFVEGLTDVAAPLVAPVPFAGWDSNYYSNSQTWGYQVRAAKLCPGTCPKSGDDCPDPAMGWSCRCGNFPPVSLLDEEGDEAGFKFASARPLESEFQSPALASLQRGKVRYPAVIGFLEIEAMRGVRLAPDYSTSVRNRRAPDRLVGQVSPTADTQWLHTDHLGSTRIVTDENGFVVAEHKYYPFGEEFFPNVAQTEEVNTHKFTGHERDKKTGLDYMMARYYKTNLSRFTAVDPIAKKQRNSRFPQRWNRYVYSLNNPVKYLDPDGRDAVAFEQNDGSIRIVIPVRFTGSGATEGNIKAIVEKTNNLEIVGESNITLEVVPTEEPIHGVLNTMNLSPGPNLDMCGQPGECVNALGGDQGHINTENEMSNEAAAHDVLHFAGIKDQYVEGHSDENGNRTSTPTPGYTDDNVMTHRAGNQLTPEQLQEALVNPTTRHIKEGQ